MAISITELTRFTPDFQTNNPVFFRPRRITGDSAYPKGGYAHGLAYSVLGAMVIAKNAEARKYNLEFDSTTGKFLVTEPQAPLIVEESLTVASNVATLGKLPAYILAVEVTAGTTTGVFRIIPAGKTPVTTQVALDFTTGILTFLSTDAVTACRVTYIPMGVGPFIEANRVIDEAVTLATAGVNLANRAALVQYVFNNTASGANRLPKIVPVGESPGSNEIAIDIVNTGNTKITPNSGQDTNAALVTYWKHSAFSKYGWTDQGDISVTSNAIVLSEVLDLAGLWIPAFGQCIVGETGAAANLQAVLAGPSGTLAANVATLDFAKNTLNLYSSDSYSTVEMPYFVFDPSYFHNVHSEVGVGRDLSGAVFDALLVMRRN